MWNILFNNTANKNALDFIAKVKSKCEQHGIELQVDLSERIDINGWKVSGVFLEKDNPRKLGIAIGKPFEKWFAVFLHETSHMDQAIENASVWANYSALQLDFDNYLIGEPPPSEMVAAFENAVDVTVLMEADCEQRSLSKIKKYELPLDAKTYCKGANAYLLYYQWLKKRYLWYKTAPYDIPEILEKMPPLLAHPSYYLKDLTKREKDLFELTQK